MGINAARFGNHTAMIIFEALRQSHAVQRALCRRMTNGRSAVATRREAFLALANELSAHETAEERHFYVPLLLDDAGLMVSRHALADHHKIDEAVDALRGVDPSAPSFATLAKDLSAEVRDHLDEEEHGTFQLAGKLFGKRRQGEMGRLYLAEYTKLGGPFADA